jgi:predicted Rossmann fold flavoprotein
MVAHPEKHLVVIGGGAAGFFCAVNAARLCQGLQVTIVEKTTKVLQKVKVSGGGRCNATHACYEIRQMAGRYPRGAKFVQKAFHHFFTTHTIQWFQSRGVALKTEADGRMFPVSDSSQQIIDCLLQEANKYGVSFSFGFDVAQVCTTGQQWKLTARDGRTLVADYLCIACGGFSKPEQFDWITKATGHSIASPVPSLFTFNASGHPLTALMGVAVPDCLVKIAGLKSDSRGPLLITHWGLSGPAVLRLSAFAARELATCAYRFTVLVNWLPAFTETSILEYMRNYRVNKGNQKLSNTEWATLPHRLWIFLLEQAGAHADMRWSDLPATIQNKLAKCLCSYELLANGKTTFKEEFVTAGGITLSEIDANTMMSRLRPNLFFAGEIMDVDGITGGYNFQHAWTSGFVAAQTIAQLACMPYALCK